MVLMLSKYSCVLSFFVVTTLAVMGYERTGEPLWKNVNRNAKIISYDSRKWTHIGEKKSWPQFNHNQLLRSEFFDTSKYGTSAFRHEYFIQQSSNSNHRAFKGQDIYFQRHSSALTNTNNFIPKMIPLIRQVVPAIPDGIKTNTYPVQWRPTKSAYPTSDLIYLMSANPSVQLNSNLFFKGDTTSPNWPIYRIQSNVHPRGFVNDISQQQSQLLQRTYSSKHVNNIPKPNVETKSDIIISKATSGRFISGKFSVPYTVGVGEEPTETHVNKNSHNAGGSSGLRQSRLNHIAVVVSTSMTVKED